MTLHFGMYVVFIAFQLRPVFGLQTVYIQKTLTKRSSCIHFFYPDEKSQLQKKVASCDRITAKVQIKYK